MMVYCVGLTGNIASGKTTVAQLFSNYGITVIDADQIAKALLAKDTQAYKVVLEHFGEQVLLDNKELNRKKLRSIVFSNLKERRWLEELLHPMIQHELAQKITQVHSSYCIVEITLLVDTKEYPYLNKILLVTADIDFQITRVMARDHCSREEALAILAAQPDENIRLKIANDVLYNNGDLDALAKQVEQLHQQYLLASG